MDCGPVVEGGLLPSWFNDVQELKRQRDFLERHFDEQAELWPREQIREVLRSERYYDGLFNPNDLQFYPLNYTRGIATAAESHGVSIYEQSRVTALETQNGTKIVRSAKGEVHARNVVVTCGGSLVSG